LLYCQAQRSPEILGARDTPRHTAIKDVYDFAAATASGEAGEGSAATGVVYGEVEEVCATV